jgi:hypothetical protein
MKPTSALFFSVKDDEKVEAIKKKFEENDIGYTYNRYKDFMLNVDLKSIKKNIDLLNEIHAIRNKKIIEDE